MFDYLKGITDAINLDLLETEAVFATVYIKGESVGEESTYYRGLGDDLDGREGDPIKFFYPEDLKSSYRIKVYPIEKSGLRLKTMIEYKQTGNTEPYDTWISCLEKNVMFRKDKTIFDVAEKISFEGTEYGIRGLVREVFGNNPVVHVFMVKQ